MLLFVLRFAIAFALLTAIFLALGAFMRREVRRKLEDEHAAGAATSLTREDYVAHGMRRYNRSWQRKALWLIYLGPLIVLFALTIIGSNG